MDLSADMALGFVSKPIPNGGSWTLTTRLGDFLAKAETRFGSRQMDWTILGSEFFGDIPCVWYPGNRKHVAIRLTESARYDFNQALFQLAHETIHLLSPNGSGPALVIEEGIATLFAEEMMAELKIEGMHASDNYIEALNLTRPLLSSHPDLIRGLRSLCPRIQDFTPDLVLSKAPELSTNMAHRLCDLFSR